MISVPGADARGCLTFAFGWFHEQEQVVEGAQVPVVRGTDEEEGVHRGRFAAVAVRRVPSERHRRARGHGAGGRVPRVRRVGHGCLWSDIGGRWGVVTFCWTPVSLFFDYAMSPS